MIKNYLLLFLTLVAITTKAQNTNPESFSFSVPQAIEYALQHNSTVLNSRIDEEIYKRKVQEFTGLGLPQISGSAQFQDFLDIPTSFLPDFITPSVYGVLLNEGLVTSAPSGGSSLFPVQFGTKYSLSGTISANQLLFDGQFFVGLQAQKAVLALTEKNTQRTETDAAVTVTKAYYTAYITTKGMELLNSNVVRIKKLLDDTKAYYQNGFVEKLDLDRITVTYNNLLIEQEKLKKQVELTNMILKFQMGMDVNSNLTLTDSLSAYDYENILQQNNFDPNNRIEYQLVQSTKALNELDKKRNQFAYIPGLYAFGSYGYNAPSNKTDFFKPRETQTINGNTTKIDRWFPTTLVGLSLALPIFDGFQKQRRIQQASLNMLKNDNDLMNIKNVINLEINQSKISLQNTNATLTARKDNVELARQVYNTTKIKYDNGIGSSLELTNASAELKEAEINYLNALYDAAIAKIDYQKATGQFK
jgi:outer membrane protein